MDHNIWIYLLIMAVVTYLIRMLPLTLIRNEIKNRTIRSFLYYVPYVTLAVMTFPAIISVTGNEWTGLAGFAAALLMAYKGQGLFKVSVTACVVVFLLELMPL